LGEAEDSGKIVAMTNPLKFTMKQLFIFLIAMISGVSSQAGLLYNYSQLAIKDLDQMSKIVRDKVSESNKTRGDKAIPLKEGVQAVFSRPNSDDMIEKIIGPLRTSLDELDSWETSVRQLVKEALGALKNPKAFKPVVQVTYAVFLENIISEMKPRARSEFENSILKQIQDANLNLTAEAKHERVLRMMRETLSPSEIAATVLTAAKEEETVEMNEGLKRTVVPNKKAAKPKPTSTPMTGTESGPARPGITGEPVVEPIPEK
jgi:hypothetical protein